MFERDTIQVIGRAAAILRACREGGAGLSLADIAVRVSLPRSTVQRIVRSLAAEGLLIAGGAARGIRLGPGIHALAAASRFDMVEFAHPHLKALSARLGETVDLAVLRGDHMVFIDQIAGSHRLRAISAVGERFPLHCTANGKAALAMLDDAALREICAGPLEPHSPATIVSAGMLRAEVGRIRKRGLAFDLEEHSAGICAVGAALTDATGAVHAVSVPMPSVRFGAMRGEVEAALRETIAKLAAGMA
jgi:DNA-binding IclR family transcriptional regulator